MRGGDKDCATRVSCLSNEEPLVVVEARIDGMREVIRENRGDSHGGVIRNGEAPLCRGGCGSVHKGTFGAEDGHIGYSWGICGRRGLKVFTSRGGDEDVVGVNGDVLVERSKEESVEDFLSDLGGSGRHCC